MSAKYSNGALIAAEEVAGIDFWEDVGESGVEAVGDDGLGAGLELGEVTDDLAAEEGGASREGGLINNDLSAFGLDALHYSLNGALTEVVGTGLHREAIDPDDALLLAGTVVLAVAAIVTGLVENLIGDKILAGAVGVNYGLDEILRNIIVVGQQLFGVFWKAIAAVAEGGVVVVRTDPGIKAHAVDD